MKKLIKQNPYFIHFGWDTGGPEDGPIMHSGIDVVYAISKDDAIRKWEDDVDISEYEGYWAEPTTEEEVQRFIKENQIDPEYQEELEKAMERYE